MLETQVGQKMTLDVINQMAAPEMVDAYLKDSREEIELIVRRTVACEELFKLENIEVGEGGLPPPHSRTHPHSCLAPSLLQHCCTGASTCTQLFTHTYVPRIHEHVQPLRRARRPTFHERVRLGDES